MVDNAGQPARTGFEVLGYGYRHTLAEFSLYTGRTHQIRVHMWWLGYPLAGDDIYGWDFDLIGRHALHCGRIWFPHPVTGERIEVTAPPPGGLPGGHPPGRGAPQGGIGPFYREKGDLVRVLFLGDVVGAYGCELLEKRLRALKKQYAADVVVVNGENSAEGNGMLPSSVRQIYDSGADVITGGNHSLRRREIYKVLDEEETLLRPVNFHANAPGKGVCVLDFLRYRFAVVNLQGLAYMVDHHRDPFAAIDEVLTGLVPPISWWTSTPKPLPKSSPWLLSGRAVSAVIGTHTHVQTADERILSGGTAYLTDAGMCGSFDSVLGVKKELAVEKMRTQLPTRFENARGQGILWGCVIDIDEKTGRARSIERVADRVE